MTSRAAGIRCKCGENFGAAGAGSSRATRHGIPTGGVGLLFEVGACDEWLSQILRVIDDGLHNEPGIAVWLCDAIKVFPLRPRLRYKERHFFANSPVSFSSS